MRAPQVPAQVDGPYVSGLSQAVGQCRAPNLGQDVLHVLIVRAQHRKTIEGQVVEELHEAVTELGEIPTMRA
jgi:hypothetical protein